MSTDKFVPTILLPEPNDPAIAAFVSSLQPNDDFKVRAEEHSLEESAQLLNQGEVDAVVVGASYPSKDVFLTAIRQIGAPNKDASSFFVMQKEGERNLYLADCAVNPDPDAHQLFRIAEQTAANVKRLGEEPVVAFLSYSTLGSAGGPSVEKVRQATAEFQQAHPEITAYGELQWDAATNEQIFKKKNRGEGYKDGKLPNVLIFPNLDAGNMMYKALERPGGYTAVGPLTQGLVGDADFHDLSRGVTPQALQQICLTVAMLVRARGE